MDQISFDDFAKLDIRIGTVTEATVPEWSHWVMRLTVDLGEEIGTRTIFAGIMLFYKSEELVGNQFPFLVNLKPKRIGPPSAEGEYEYSEGMMMVAMGPLIPTQTVEGEEIREKPILFSVSEKVPNGAKIS
jgi:tRNA-binding EMAP/Myf-like protein